MKFASKTLIAFFVVSSTEAFSITSRQNAVIRPTTRTKSTLHMSSVENSEDKVAALRAAAAKARADAERLRQELGASSPPVEETTPALPKKTAEEVKSIVPTLLAESDLEKQSAGWKELKDSKSVQAFGSANLKSFPVTLNMLEQRTGLNAESLGLDDTTVDLDDFKYSTLWLTGGCTLSGILSLALLPPNIGATLCYLFALIPVLYIAIGSTAPAVIANGIAALKGAGSDSGDEASPQDRICRHEAAHFCCGYWCGLPIREYSVKEGVARVEFAVSSRQFQPTEIAALTVTALAGLVGEAMEWEKVLNGSATADLLQLEQVFRQSSDFLGAAQQQDLTRWGALTASLLLRQNAEAYENVVKAFARQAPLEECIALLE